MRSPPGGDTAPRMLTDATAPPSVWHAPGPLVEVSQRGGQPGRIALLGGQLVRARPQLAQGFGPARGRVGDHHRVIPHVAVVLGDRHARVDARLARHHGHVRGIGDQHRAVEQRLSGARVLERLELLQHVGELVPALAATDVHDHRRVTPLRDLLQRHRLARAEPARDRRRAAPQRPGTGDRSPADRSPAARPPA